MNVEVGVDIDGAESAEELQGRHMRIERCHQAIDARAIVAGKGRGAGGGEQLVERRRNSDATLLKQRLIVM